MDHGQHADDIDAAAAATPHAAALARLAPRRHGHRTNPVHDHRRRWTTVTTPATPPLLPRPRRTPRHSHDVHAVEHDPPPSQTAAPSHQFIFIFSFSTQYPPIK